MAFGVAKNLCFCVQFISDLRAETELCVLASKHTTYVVLFQGEDPTQLQVSLLLGTSQGSRSRGLLLLTHLGYCALREMFLLLLFSMLSGNRYRWEEFL